MEFLLYPGAYAISTNISFLALSKTYDLGHYLFEI
jgi:hypothetical protein